MKKISIIFLLLIFIHQTALANQGYIITSDENSYKQTKTTSISNLPYGNYLKFYNINTGEIDAEYVYLKGSNENIFMKSLSKEEREDYKYVRKIQKLIMKDKWDEVFALYPNYFPAYLQYYSKCCSNKNYTEAIRALNKIRNFDIRGQIFSSKVINKAFADLYYKSGQYSNALEYLKMYDNSNDDEITFSIANCYYNLGSYNQAINYLNRLKNKNYDSKELTYDCYMRLKNIKLANQYAKELLKEKYNYENLMRVQAMEENDSSKLSYCYHARELAIQEKDIRAVNQIIADLEQKKLDKSVSKISQFVKVPKWSDYAKQIPPNVTLSEICAKQDEFFKLANTYISEYKGQDLVNSFSSLNQEFTNYIQAKHNQYYQEMQLRVQQALLEQQERENALRQQMIYEQQMQNYMNRQYYYMSRPYPYYYRHHHHMMGDFW